MVNGKQEHSKKCRPLKRWHIAGYICIPDYNKGCRTSICGSLIAHDIKEAIAFAEDNGWCEITECSVKSGITEPGAIIGFE